jgi:hypothetical protein
MGIFAYEDITHFGLQRIGHAGDKRIRTLRGLSVLVLRLGAMLLLLLPQLAQ